MRPHIIQEIPPHDHPLRLHYRMTLHTKILPQTIIQKILPNSHHTNFHPVQPCIRRYLNAAPSLSQENIRRIIHKIHRIIHKNLPRLHPMSGWNPVPSTTPGGWGTSPT